MQFMTLLWSLAHLGAVELVRRISTDVKKNSAIWTGNSVFLEGSLGFISTPRQPGSSYLCTLQSVFMPHVLLCTL